MLLLWVQLVLSVGIARATHRRTRARKAVACVNVPCPATGASNPDTRRQETSNRRHRTAVKPYAPCTPLTHRTNHDAGCLVVLTSSNKRFGIAHKGCRSLHRENVDGTGGCGRTKSPPDAGSHAGRISPPAVGAADQLKRKKMGRPRTSVRFSGGGTTRQLPQCNYLCPSTYSSISCRH